jgi:hypothetical protein
MIKKRASLILVLVDGYTNSTNLKGVVNIRTENGIYAKNKGDGCYVFVDCYPGSYRIFVEPSAYKNQSFEIYMGDEVLVKYLMLQPGRTYPLLKQAIRISGRCNGEIYAALEGGETGSVMEVCPSGEKEIRLYFSGISSVLGRRFYFTNGEQYGVRRITGEEPDERLYQLDEELDFEVTKYTQILPVYEAYIENGKYFLVVRSVYKKIYLLGASGKKTLELQADIQEYNFDYTEE